MKKILWICSLLLITAACKKERKGCVETAKPDCMCTLQYAPVCGCNGKTYGNSCEAECYGITEYTQGPCR